MSGFGSSLKAVLRDYCPSTASHWMAPTRANPQYLLAESKGKQGPSGGHNPFSCHHAPAMTALWISCMQEPWSEVLAYALAVPALQEKAVALREPDFS